MLIVCLQILEQNSACYLYRAFKHGLICPESCAGAGALIPAVFLTVLVPQWFQHLKDAERLQRTCSASWWCPNWSLLTLEAWSLSCVGHRKSQCSYAVCRADTSQKVSAESSFSPWTPSAASILIQLSAELTAQPNLRMGVYGEHGLKPKYPRLSLFPYLFKGLLLLSPAPMNFRGATENQKLV